LLPSIRDFKEAFSSLPDPVVTALVNNAGIQHIGETAYTPDGFEITFGANHLGPFYLTLLLLPFMKQSGSITFTASGTHDPTLQTGIAPPVYTTGQELAFPKETAEKASMVGQRRYSTSKLANILTTYTLSEKLKGQNIRVNAYDPGLVPGTGSAGSYPAHLQFLWKYVLPDSNTWYEM